MSSLQWILAWVFLAAVDAGAQLSGTFKISKVAPDTGAELVTFNADNTADVVYGWLIKTLAGNLTKWERSTKEARGTYFTERIEDRIAKWKALPKQDDQLKSMTGNLIQFKEQGYDLYVVVNYKTSTGTQQTSCFVRKGNELVDFLQGSIFRKPFWSF